MKTSQVKVTEQKIADYLGGRFNGKAEVAGLLSLSGGACQDNYAVDVKLTGDEAGDFALVMRTDKGGALLTSLSRVQEFQVAKVAFEAGVKTPRPFWAEEDTSHLGHPFYFMERISGKATGRYIVKDKSLNEYRKQLPADLAENLAKIHSIRMEEVAELPFLEKPPGKDSYIELHLKELVTALDELPQAHPVLTMAVNWLLKNAPAVDDFVLSHGDFRTGNFMVSEEGLQGIVDWEFAHWGDRHEDIGWLCMRDWRFGKNNLPVGGITQQDSFYELYEKFAGVKVDPFKVLFWEIIGNLRWALGAAQQGERHLSGKDKGIEFASIGRRVPEMEYEVMRLIDSAS